MYKLTNAVTVHIVLVLYLYISVQAYSPHPTTVPAYPDEFLHINNQRAHNNYKNIILKEPNENPQRAHLGQRAPLWTTLLYSTRSHQRNQGTRIEACLSGRPAGPAQEQSETRAPRALAEHLLDELQVVRELRI